MRKISLVSLVLFSFSIVKAQPPKVYIYSVDNITLPVELNKQVCISGMKLYKGQLYLASERCPKIIVLDPSTATISNTISLQVPLEFEMEGMTSYKDKLYLVSENVAAVYEVTITTGEIKLIQTSNTLPAKSRDGDGMEGIAANEKYNKFYLLRERDDNMTHSQIFTFSAEPGNEHSPVILRYESTIELPLENPQWRYSDICVDSENSKLLCLKSYSKGKLRQQFIESIDIDEYGELQATTLTNIPVENFSETSNKYKDQDFSMNLEGITVNDYGTIYIVSDNTSGKASCELDAKEKTILLQLKKK